LNFITLQLSKLNRRAIRPIVVGLVALVVILVVVSLWRSHKPSDPLANLPPGTYQPAQSGETLPLPASSHRSP